jgi:dUTP pyrophosphatase
MTIQIAVTRLHPDATIPTYATDGDAGLDLSALEPTVVGPGERKLVKTGIAIAIPAGHVGLVHPRSGLAFKHGVTVLNAPGTIDSGYRGDIGVILYNAGATSFQVYAGDRIAQLVVQEFVTASLVEVDELPSSDRGVGGFGSTGVSA